ncbi:hypothetical protein OVA24_17505 [Luteolibacter sp. SL250]|uniref:hypothetical protein n=1 Tax=Luteolibacter sp. SL250 TaxID=2995170 RepID=UPI00226E2919|nr:hypothetical protein [Luteolibacter sp. SL250]WAC19029.1 hypothetical protein OVA24_17505 [Luteolibacter sp. SL250]
MSSCEKERTSPGSGTPPGNRDSEEILELANGHPSDLTIRRAAWTMNTTYIDMPFKRGQVLEALGGGGVPVGTLLYPIKFEDFPYPIYLSRDEFGDWRFNIGEKPTLHAVRTPPPPETEDAKREREKQEKAEAKDHEERMANSARWQKEEAEKARQKAMEKRQAEAKIEEAKERKAEERVRQDEKRREKERAALAESNRRGAEERLRQREEQERAIAAEAEETRRKLGQGIEPIENARTEEVVPDTPMKPSEKKNLSETVPSPDKAVRLAEAKAELAALESNIATERQRFQQATDTINRLTNFKKVPVKEGSAAYHQCMDASRVIQNVEKKAPGMNAEKARLVTLVQELEN